MRLKRAFSVSALFLLLTSSFILPILARVGSAQAQTTSGSVGFVDKVTINLKRKTSSTTVQLVDRDPYDDTYNYVLKDVASQWPLGFGISARDVCADEVTISNFNGSPVAHVTERNKNTAGHCDETSYNTPVDSATLGVRNINGYRLDDNNIWLPIGFKDPGCDSEKASGINNKDEYYQRAPKKLDNGADNTAFVANQYDQTKDTGDATIFITTQGGGKAVATNDLGNGSCQGASYNYDIQLAANGSATVPPSTYGAITAPAPGGKGGGNSGNAAGVADSCESQSEVLGWIMCPVIKLLDEAVTWLDGQIQQLLTTPDPLKLSGPNGNALEKAWGRIRNITLILIVPAMLIMVISTAFGFSFVDAFTIKRAMPRLLIAIVAISTSFYIMSFLVNITNSFGQGILGLLTQPFGGGDTSLASLVNASKSAALTGVGAGVFLALVATGVVSFMIILSFAFVTVLALLVGFVVLTLRQLLILALIVIAPVAILLWIFPNTEKGWKMWWGNFSKLLLMFPLIMAMIAAGRMFAWIMANSGAYSGVDDLLTQLMVIVAYVAPFFFIPAAFKWGGQLFGSLAGAVTNSTRGIREGQAKSRAANRAEGLQNFKAGAGSGRFRQSAFVRRVGLGVGAGKKGNFGFGAKGAANTSAAVRAHAAGVTMKDPTFQQIQHDDEAMRAATYASAAEAEAAGISSDAIKKVQATIGFGKAQQVAAAQQMLLNKTAYRDAGDVARTIARVSGGNADMETSLRGFNNAYAKGLGRHDLSAVSGDAIAAANEEMATGRVRDDAAYSGALAAENHQNTMAGFENADTYTLGKENKTSYKNMAEAHAREYADSVRAYAAEGGQTEENRGRVIASRTRLEETIKNASGATGINARTITEIVGNSEVAGADERIREVEADDGVSILGARRAPNPEQGATQGEVGSGGLARTRGPGLSPDEIARQSGQGGGSNDEE